MIGEMWTSMAITGKTIIALLGMLSVYSLAVVVERFVALRWSTRSSRTFADEVEGFTDPNAMRDRATAPEYGDFASLAYVVGESLVEYDRIREILTSYAASSLGRRLASRMLPLHDARKIGELVR